MTMEERVDMITIRERERLMFNIAFNLKETAKEAEPDTTNAQLQVEQFDDFADQIGNLNESAIADEPNTSELAIAVEEEFEEPAVKPDLYRLAVEMQKLAIQVAYWKSFVWFNDEGMKGVKQYFSSACRRTRAQGSPEDQTLDKSVPSALTDFRDKVTVLLEQWPRLLEATQPLRRFPPFAINDDGDAKNRQDYCGDVDDMIFPEWIINEARKYIKQHPLDEEYAGIGDVLDTCETVIRVHEEMMKHYYDLL